MWHTIAEEKKLRADADGIRSKIPCHNPCGNHHLREVRETRIKQVTTLPTAFGRVSVLCRPK